MVLAERSCWRSGTDRRGGTVRSGSARVGRAASDTGGTISEAWDLAEPRASSVGGGITTRACSRCFRGRIAYSFHGLLGPLLSLYAADFFTDSEERPWTRPPSSPAKP